MYELTSEVAGNNDEAITRLIHPDDLPAYRASLEASQRDLSPWHLEYRVVLPKQGLRWRRGAHSHNGWPTAARYGMVLLPILPSASA